MYIRTFTTICDVTYSIKKLIIIKKACRCSFTQYEYCKLDAILSILWFQTEAHFSYHHQANTSLYMIADGHRYLTKRIWTSLFD